MRVQYCLSNLQNADDSFRSHADRRSARAHAMPCHSTYSTDCPTKTIGARPFDLIPFIPRYPYQIFVVIYLFHTLHLLEIAVSRLLTEEIQFIFLFSFSHSHWNQTTVMQSVRFRLKHFNREKRKKTYGIAKTKSARCRQTY